MKNVIIALLLMLSVNAFSQAKSEFTDKGKYLKLSDECYLISDLIIVGTGVTYFFASNYINNNLAGYKAESSINTLNFLTLFAGAFSLTYRLAGHAYAINAGEKIHRLRLAPTNNGLGLVYSF